jgi:hypothetical protein
MCTRSPSSMVPSTMSPTNGLASCRSSLNRRAFAAVLYSKEHGDLLISDAGKEIVAFNFTERKALYERK